MRAAKTAILMVCLLACAGAFPAHAAGPNKNEAEGRRHARKANQLADVNKCKAAIPEYTKALRLLKDPTLLFNRAECFRRTGDSAKAVADYRKFLVQLPGAPNRGQVESQIAALNKKSAPAAAAKPSAKPSIVASAKPPSAASAKPSIVPSAKPSSTRAAMPNPAPSSASPASSAPVVEDGPVAPAVPERELASPSSTGSLPSAPSLADTPGPMALVDRRDASGASADSQSGSSHWWISVLGAVVLVGAGAGTYFALKQGGTDIPPSALGNFKF